MKVEVIIKRKDLEIIDLSLLKWLQLKLTGKTYFEHFQLEGWKGKLPFYIFKCGACKKYSLNYPQGYGQYLYCNNHKSIFPKSKPEHIIVPQTLEVTA